MGINKVAMQIPFTDCKLNKRCPRLGMHGLRVHALSENSMTAFKCT